MRETNPYTAPATASIGWGFANRVWTAYLIAPFVAPAAAAVVIFLMASVQQVINPDNVDANPMSIIFAPLCSMIVGVPISYAVAGLIGMPSVYWLRSRDQLSGVSIHLVALVCAAAIASLIPIIGLLTVAFGASMLAEIFWSPEWWSSWCSAPSPCCRPPSSGGSGSGSRSQEGRGTPGIRRVPASNLTPVPTIRSRCRTADRYLLMKQ